MTIQHTNPRWYLIQCKPRQDARAEENLRHQNFRCYRPRHQVERSKCGRRTVTEESLFPGYLFIQLHHLNDNWHPIRSTRGVNKLVTFGTQPIAVPDELIAQLRRQLSEKPYDNTSLKPGDSVRINGGSFKEMDAIFLARDGEKRIIILLQLLHREHSINVPLSVIEKI